MHGAPACQGAVGGLAHDATFGAVAPTQAAVRRLLFSPGIPEDAVRRHHARLQGESFLAYLDLLGLDLCRPRKGAVPTLVIGAGGDAMFTRGEVEAVSAAHGAAVEFVPGMAHGIMLEPGWETVADRIAGWALTVATSGTEDRRGTRRRRTYAAAENHPAPRAIAS